MRALASLACFFALALSIALPRSAAAFCGFYVSGADAKLQNRATQVVLMRSGTRTVLSMRNAYEGPPQDFAMVVPVPVVLQKEQVKTLTADVLDRVDQLGAPRLVEYWEQDPCDPPAGMGAIGRGQGFGYGAGRLGGSHRSKDDTVTVEAEFTVGEYEIVILSATDATALDGWLRENHYKIPDGAEALLRPYVQSGMKFFVAKVDIEKVTMKDGRALLSPLRFHYDSDTFSLPIRLGLINAGDAQDLIVSILSEKQRYEVANYPNVVIPTNLEVSDDTRKAFPSFYAALLDETLRKKPGAVITEYAWDAGMCDPCPGPTLSGADLASLGADVTNAASLITGLRGVTVRLDHPTVAGRLPPEVITRIARQSLDRFRGCYEIALRTQPTLAGRATLQFAIGQDSRVAVASVASSDLKDPAMERCLAATMKALTFPAPEAGIATVKLGIRFSLGGTLSGPRSTGMVLTRLHMRYAKDALGEDLVFKAVAPIQGGREIRAEGKLESGAITATSNNFQARYAIRHPWTGPVACDKPVRGVWGGPPEGEAPATQAARDLAFVTRGAVLATFLKDSLPALADPAAPTDPPPASTPPSASASVSASATGPLPVGSAASGSGAAPAGGCGCHTGPDPSAAPWTLALSLLAVARVLARRPRRVKAGERDPRSCPEDSHRPYYDS